MKILKNPNEKDIPVFATATAAASYKVGEEGFVDLLFLRSQFVLSQTEEPTDIDGSPNLAQQKAEMFFSNVASVTLTAAQATELVKAIEGQLKNLANS